MHFLRTAAVAVACVLVTGCVFFAGHRPLLGYSDKNHPKSDTALVVCAEQPGFICGITSVNERNTWEKLNGGKTPWVRILPGAQVIKLTLSNSHLINRPWLKIDNVQAGHVYRIDVAFNGTALTAKSTDLGKMDSYTIHMPRQPWKPKAYTATFD
ncbi:hypothetical protein [Dyella caseinilytica]|uniref:Uncharacterized protein n=1 Tax=Dyella caseinilytica TaxID=1849581 RepID=A0ABX7GR72_9GAMM|nr:hypothetical protein [Dyella caseinilytica]QRN52573.1 hypothetical protein ISN74_14000 [Dyella caseinilytica]GGA07128.1 hypothetical protein GCM10011408_30290 [Dyella caseinilytica]